MINQRNINAEFFLVSLLLFLFVLSTDSISEPFKITYKHYLHKKKVNMRLFIRMEQNESGDLSIHINDIQVDKYPEKMKERVKDATEAMKTMSVTIVRSKQFKVQKIIFKDREKNKKYIQSDWSKFSAHSRKPIQTLSDVFRMIVFSRPKNPENSQKWTYETRKKEDVSDNKKYAFDFYRFHDVNGEVMYKGIYKFTDINNESDSLDYSVQSLRNINKKINIFSRQSFQSYRGWVKKEEEKAVDSFRMELEETDQ